MLTRLCVAVAALVAALAGLLSLVARPAQCCVPRHGTFGIRHRSHAA